MEIPSKLQDSVHIFPSDIPDDIMSTITSLTWAPEKKKKKRKTHNTESSIYRPKQLQRQHIRYEK